MKKVLPLITVATLALAASAFAQTAKPPVSVNPNVARSIPVQGQAKATPPAQTAPTQPAATVPTGPEPTGVYGWIAIVDPSTGQPWLPLDYERNPPAVHGYPISIDVRFIRADGGEQTSVAAAGGEGLTVDPQRGAWRYSLRFDHNATMTGAPSVGDTPGTIRYNPARWRFLDVSVGEYRWSVLGRGSTTVLWSVPFTRRSSNFDWPVAP